MVSRQRAIEARVFRCSVTDYPDQPVVVHGNESCERHANVPNFDDKDFSSWSRAAVDPRIGRRFVPSTGHAIRWCGVFGDEYGVSEWDALIGRHRKSRRQQ